MENFVKFDESSITPRQIREILKYCNRNSAPGPDGINFGILHKLNHLHGILATLFTKVFQNGSPPSVWSESIIKLIHKKGSTEEPSNFRMIALSNTIGKLFHLIISKRTTNYVISNKMIDPFLQKGFIPGINGCVDHNLVMDEIIKDAKMKRRTVHITFFDLADAFGSVPHQLIFDTFKRLHMQEQIIKYLKCFYSNLMSKVVTTEFDSEEFKFKRGVTQGDPYSPIVFLMAFQPILDYLYSQKSSGYNLNNTDIITLPYADDFCLITTNKRTHQKLMTEIDERITIMGMKVKPSKCRSFSISSGSPKVGKFAIGVNKIPSIRHEDQKFLGKLLFFQTKSADTLHHIKDEIETKLLNIDNTKVRSEYKIWIYKYYFLPSIRFFLTVHDLPKTALETLDKATAKYLKKWLGLPNSATKLVINAKEALDIETISTLHNKCHVLKVAHIRHKGDDIVNHALDGKIDREKSWNKKQSNTIKAIEVYHKCNQPDGPIHSEHTQELKCYICKFEASTLSVLKWHTKATHQEKTLKTVKEAAKKVITNEEKSENK